jgi:hypothetical protein
MTALMLMALMLYINAIKLFHTHPGSYSPVYSFHAVHAHALPSISPDNTVRHIVHGNHCAICDFQLAKDADVAAAGIDKEDRCLQCFLREYLYSGFSRLHVGPGASCNGLDLHSPNSFYRLHCHFFMMTPRHCYFKGCKNE